MSEDCEPFWAAAEKSNTPVSVHISLVHRGQQKQQIGSIARKGNAALTGFSAAGLTTMPTIIGETIFWGIFDKFPDLQMVGVECGAGWIPYFLEQMDDRYWRNRSWAKSTLQRVPSEYFRRNWNATFIIDRYGVANRHSIGVDNMMWSTDYPHHGADWPYSRKVIDEMFQGVAADERQKMLAANCVRLYGLEQACEDGRGAVRPPASAPYERRPGQTSRSNRRKPSQPNSTGNPPMSGWKIKRPWRCASSTHPSGVTTEYTPLARTSATVFAATWTSEPPWSEVCHESYVCASHNAWGPMRCQSRSGSSLTWM